MRKYLPPLASFLLAASVFATGDRIGVCPRAPANPMSVPEVPGAEAAPSPDAKPAGSVSLLMLISDTGEVCDVQLIGGFDKIADTQALRSVRKWRFEAMLKNGVPAPQVIRMEVKFFRTPSGELVKGLRGQKPR